MIIIKHEFENKIMGLGPFAEVLSLAHLRETIASQLAQAISRYNSDATT